MFAKLHAKLGDFWWYSLVLFCAGRTADVLNAFVGLWLVPKYVDPSELGAVMPLTQFANFLVLANDAATLPPQYNFLTHFQMFKTRNDVLRATGIPESAWYTEEQYAGARKNPIIHHFLGHTLGRPWYRESLNPLRPLYQKIAVEAGLSEIAEQSRPTEFEHKILFLAWKTLPHALFSYVCRTMYSYYFRTRYGV